MATAHDIWDSSRRKVLLAVIDRIVPPDQDTGATGFGADGYLQAQFEADARLKTAPIAAGLDFLAKEAAALGASFHELPPEVQDRLLGAIQEQEWFTDLVILTQEGVYADPANGGNLAAAAWRMIGYEHRLPEGPSGPPPVPPHLPRALGATGSEDYDVIVVGAGASGGVMACRLAEAGHSVLLLERGRELTYLGNGHRDHLRNHRLARYGHNTGPQLTGNPRVYVGPEGRPHIVRPHEQDYHNIASGVGSGTSLFGGLAWRFHPDDFRMASRYGVPEGSSLVDWPIGYDDLAPFYDWVEWEIGVAGDSGDANSGPRTRGYPMPPLAPSLRTKVLARGAQALNLATFTPPILVNTVARAGRDACCHCGSCVGFPCPTDAKNGTQNTMIPRALATGRTTLLTGAHVTRIEQDGNGRVIGVRYLTDSEPGPTEHFVRAKAVVVCAGAIETARLLLLSASSAHPEGLGNNFDQVGRHLQGHYYPAAYGLFEEEVHPSEGPGVSIATTDFVHGNDGIIGGAMIADDFVMLPTVFFHQALPPDLRRWGSPAKDFMRENFRRVAKITGPVHEIPDPGCRVQLADLTDRLGLRVAKLSGQVHVETIRTAEFISHRSADWLAASGARDTWRSPVVRRLSAGQHQAGTCRMGAEPASSVTDPYGRVWGHSNLFVCDGSLHPTNGAYNPVLTIMAMAARNAQFVSQSI